MYLLFCIRIHVWVLSLYQVTTLDKTNLETATSGFQQDYLLVFSLESKRRAAPLTHALLTKGTRAVIPDNLILSLST